MKIYLDTSVYSGCVPRRHSTDKRIIEPNTVMFNASIDLINTINSLGITVLFSKVVDYEIGKTSSPRKEKIENVVARIKKRKTILLTEKADSIAKEYILDGILPLKSIDDAQHIALAVLNKADYIASWNFKHMIKRTKQYENVSKLLNLAVVPILAPNKLLTKLIRKVK